MTEEQCRDRIRCALSDRSGVLRFESFDIVDAPECEDVSYSVREYVIGRALAEVNVDHVRDLVGAEHPLCARTLAGLLAESQEMFGGGGKRLVRSGTREAGQ